MKLHEKEKIELMAEDAIHRAVKVFASAQSTGHISDLQAREIAIQAGEEFFYEKLDEHFPDE